MVFSFYLLHFYLKIEGGTPLLDRGFACRKHMHSVAFLGVRGHRSGTARRRGQRVLGWVVGFENRTETLVMLFRALLRYLLGDIFHFFLGFFFGKSKKPILNSLYR